MDAACSSIQILDDVFREDKVTRNVMGDFEGPFIYYCRTEAGMVESVHSHKTVRSISRNVKVPSAFRGHWLAFDGSAKVK